MINFQDIEARRHNRMVTRMAWNARSWSILKERFFERSPKFLEREINDSAFVRQRVIMS